MAQKFKKSSFIFDIDSRSPFKLSRSKIDLFIDCQRCFFLSERYGIKRPKFPPFTLNIAVDALLKKEFDIYRSKGQKHPLMKSYGVDAIPYHHKDINIWRENFVGIRFHDKESSLLVFGAIDDVWINSKEELVVVDYKATAKDSKIEKLDDSRWHNQYRRQMEVYQWLLKKNGFKTSSTGYFMYLNGKKDSKAFDGKLEFDISLISYVGDSSWMDNTLKDIKKCLVSGDIPPMGDNCEYCDYRETSGKVFQNIVNNKVKKKKRDSDISGNDITVKNNTLFI